MKIIINNKLHCECTAASRGRDLVLSPLVEGCIRQGKRYPSWMIAARQDYLDARLEGFVILVFSD